MANFYKWDNEDLLLNLYVQANARKDELVGEYGDNLKVRITALPIENKANKHLLKFLAKIFAVAPSQVAILKGENQRAKRIKISKPKKYPDYIKAYKN